MTLKIDLLVQKYKGILLLPFCDYLIIGKLYVEKYSSYVKNKVLVKNLVCGIELSSFESKM